MFKALSVIALTAMAVGITGLFFSNALFAKQPWVIAIQVAMFALMCGRGSRLVGGPRASS